MNLTLNSLERWRDAGLFVMRVAIGAAFVYVGYQKLSDGPSNWTEVGSSMKLLGLDSGHLYWGMAATFAEFLGGIALILGLATRLAAISLFFTMLVASIVMAQHLSLSDAKSVGAFCYPFTLGASTFALIFLGAGSYSLDGGKGGGRSSPSADKN